MPKPKIDYIEAATMHGKGASAEQIAQALGCSLSTVYRALRIEGAPLSPDTAKILKLHEEGLTQREIAAQLGVSPATVGKYVRAEDASRTKGPRPLSEGRVKAIIALNEQGFTRQEIADRVGVSRTTVFKHLKEAGLIREPMPITEIIERRQAGETMTQIAQDAGLSVAAISARLKKAKQV